MKYAAIVAVLVLLVVLTGCDGLMGDPADRIIDFMSDINTSSDYATIQQTHFSPSMADYADLATSLYWEGTFFESANVGDLVLESTAAIASGATASHSTTIVSVTPAIGPYNIDFVLVGIGDDPFYTDWLISSITVWDTGSPVPIQLVR